MSLLERFISSEDARLLKTSKLIDRIDRITGPVASSLQLYGGPELQVLGNVISLVELGVCKVPFVFTYLQKTKDYDALVHWMPKEIFSNMVPYGDVIDIMNSYSNRTRWYLEQQVSKEYEKNKFNVRDV